MLIAPSQPYHGPLFCRQGASTWTPRLAKLLQVLGEAYNTANPDFGDLLQGYGNDKPGEALLTVAANQVCAFTKPPCVLMHASNLSRARAFVRCRLVSVSGASRSL